MLDTWLPNDNQNKRLIPLCSLPYIPPLWRSAALLKDLFLAFLCFMVEGDRQEGMGDRGEYMPPLQVAKSSCKVATVRRQESNPGRQVQDPGSTKP